MAVARRAPKQAPQHASPESVRLAARTFSRPRNQHEHAAALRLRPAAAGQLLSRTGGVAGARAAGELHRRAAGRTVGRAALRREELQGAARPERSGPTKPHPGTRPAVCTEASGQTASQSSWPRPAHLYSTRWHGRCLPAHMPHNPFNQRLPAHPRPHGKTTTPLALRQGEATEPGPGSTKTIPGSHHVLGPLTCLPISSNPTPAVRASQGLSGRLRVGLGSCKIAHRALLIDSVCACVDVQVMWFDVMGGELR